MKYNFSELWSANFFGFYHFKHFIEFASDEEAQINYYKRLGAVHADKNGVSKGEVPEEFMEYMLKTNREALEMIKNQQIVFLFTRYEFIVQDAVKSLFCNEPRRLLKFFQAYHGYEEAIKFSLKEFINSNSKEEYVEVISERLSSKILSGKPTDVIKRIKCLLKFEDVDGSVLDELMIKRNNIVHEGRIYQIEVEELEKYYKTVEKLLKNIAIALRENKIYVIDEGDFLSENT